MIETSQSGTKKTQEIVERINKVVKYIEQSIDREMSLDELAGLACFSPFHFQRVFKEVMDETPKQFIKRLRLEEAARIFALNPRQKILEVAIKTGYQSLEAFSRAFKDYYSISPDHFRNSTEIEHIKFIQNPYRQKAFASVPKLEVSFASHRIEFETLKIGIVKRPLQRCVYIKTTLEFPPLINDCYKRIKQWSQVRELVTHEADMFGLIIDYPIFTPLDKCRFYACVAIDQPASSVGLIHYHEISSARYATFTIGGGIPEIFKASSFLVHSWLPENGYKVKLDPVILVPLKDPVITPFNENVYQVFIPVEPA
jgi:AraC family transcriptional regulator